MYAFCRQPLTIVHGSIVPMCLQRGNFAGMVASAVSIHGVAMPLVKLQFQLISSPSKTAQLCGMNERCMTCKLSLSPISVPKYLCLRKYLREHIAVH